MKIWFFRECKEKKLSSGLEHSVKNRYFGQYNDRKFPYYMLPDRWGSGGRGMRAKESAAGRGKCIFDEARWDLIQQTKKQHFILFKGLGRKYGNLPKKIL